MTTTITTPTAARPETQPKNTLSTREQRALNTVTYAMNKTVDRFQEALDNPLVRRALSATVTGSGRTASIALARHIVLSRMLDVLDNKFKKENIKEKMVLFITKAKQYTDAISRAYPAQVQRNRSVQNFINRVNFFADVLGPAQEAQVATPSPTGESKATLDVLISASEHVLRDSETKSSEPARKRAKRSRPAPRTKTVIERVKDLFQIKQVLMTNGLTRTKTDRDYAKEINQIFENQEGSIFEDNQEGQLLGALEFIRDLFTERETKSARRLYLGIQTEIQEALGRTTPQLVYRDNIDDMITRLQRQQKTSADTKS